MARITILELTQRLAATNAQLEALRLENSALRCDVQRLTRQLGETVDKVIHADQPAETERLVRIAGRLCRIVQERVASNRVVKRYIPV